MGGFYLFEINIFEDDCHLFIPNNTVSCPSFKKLIEGLFLPVNIGMTELQQQALTKFNKILMGNKGELRGLRLFNIQDLLHKETLTEDDIQVLKHFLISDKKTIEQTTYVANSAIYPSSWGHTVTILNKKSAK